MIKNKQRLPRVSHREKLAAITGGCIDDSIPEEKINKRLANEGKYTFDTIGLLPVVRRCAADCRGFANPGWRGMVRPPSLGRAEIVKQADIVARDILELIERFDNLHPVLDCWASGALYASGGEFLNTVVSRVSADLYRIRGAIVSAGKTVEKFPRKTNSKGNYWTRARDAIAEALVLASEPRMAKKPAVALATDLLELCGCRSPRKSRS